MNRMELNRNRLLASLVAAGLLAGMTTSALGAGYLDDLDIARAQIGEIKKGDEKPTLSGSFLAALSASSQGDDPAAIDNYRNVLAIDDSNENVQQSLFAALIANGEVAEAIEFLNTIAPEKQNLNLNRIVIAANAIKQKSWSRAVTSVDKIEGSALDDMVTKIVGAWALFGERKTDAAVTRVQSIEGPDWVLMIKEYHLGLLHAANGQDKEAMTFFEQAAARRNVAAALTETYMRAIEALARMQAKAGDLDKAATTASEGLELLPSHPPLVQFATLDASQKSAPLVKTAQQGTAEVFYNVGSAISRQGGLPFAQGYLQLARYLTPQSDQVLIALANTYSDQKKFVRANELFGEIVPESAYHKRAQLETGLNLNKMDQFPAAEKILSALFNDNPADGVIALSLGSVYSQQEDHGKAAGVYDRVIEAIGTPQDRDWIMFYRRGIAHERTKNWPQAEADFKKALELSPDQPDVLNYLGYSWIDQGTNLDEGLNMVKKAVELKPNSGFIIDSLGWAYYRLGRYDDAVAELTRALELMPSDPVVNDHLGDAFWMAGRKLEAVFQWKHALSHKPTPDDQVKIQQKLSTGLTH